MPPIPTANRALPAVATMNVGVHNSFRRVRSEFEFVDSAPRVCEGCIGAERIVIKVNGSISATSKAITPIVARQPYTSLQRLISADSTDAPADEAPKMIPIPKLFCDSIHLVIGTAVGTVNDAQ